MTTSTSVERRRRVARLALLLSTAAITVPVHADPLASPPTYRENITGPGGVNIVTGALTVSSTDITAGTEDDPAKLVLNRSYNSQSGGNTPFAPLGAFFSHSLVADLNWGGYPCSQGSDPTVCAISINLLGESYTFGIANGAYSSTLKDGATLSLISSSPYTFRLRTKDGTTAIFEVSSGYLSGVYNNHDTFVKYVEFANGEFWSFAYESAGAISNYGNPVTINRLASVTNSRGYGLAFSYVNPQVGGGAARQQRLVSQVSAFKVVCASSCDRQVTSSVSYGYSGDPHGAVDEYGQPVLDLATISLPDGTQKHLHYDQSPYGGYLRGISTGSNSYNDVSYDYVLIPVQEVYEDDPSYIGPYVAQVTDGGGKYTIFGYDYDSRTMTVTTPLNESTVYHSAYNPRNGAGPGNEPLPDWVEDPLTNVTSYSYDVLGRLQSMTDANQHVTSQVLDDRGNATEVRRHADAGSADLVSTASFPDCDDTNFRFCNKPSYTVDARGARTDYSYDQASGGLTVRLDPADGSGQRSVTSEGYSAFAPAAGVSAPDGVATPSISLRTTEDRCLSSTVTGATVDFGFTCPASDRLRTAYNYAPSTNSSPSRYELTSVTVDPDGLAETTSYTYDDAGNRQSEDGPQPGAGDTTTYAYDGSRRLTQTTYPTVNGRTPVTKTTYDGYGRATEIDRSLGSGWVTQTAVYDARGLKTSATGIDGVTETYAYDDDGRLQDTSKTVDGVARVTRNIYDAAGQVTQVRKAVGTPLEQAYVTWTYSPTGKKLSEQDANGNVTTSCYDMFDRLAELRFPSQSAPAGSAAPSCSAIGIGGALPAGVTRESYARDENGNVTTLTRRTGAVIAMSYDGLNRMSLKHVPEADRDVTYGYDLAGRRIAATLPGVNAAYSVGWGYDKLGRVLTETSNGRAVTHSYDPGFTWHDLQWPGGLRVRESVDALNRVGAVQEANGPTLASYDYDELSRRLSISRGNGTSTTYMYNGQQRLQSLSHTIAGGSVSIGFPSYNEAGEVLTMTRDNDAYAFTGAYNVNRGYGVNALNQYTNAGSATLSYDAAGNLTSDGSSAYGYDSDNRLVSASGLVSANLAYDATGRLARIASGGQARNFLYDDDRLIGEYADSGAALRSHAHGPGTDEPLVTYGNGGRAWLYADEQGSVIARANDAGAATTTGGYDEYGSSTVDFGTFGYTGQVRTPELGSLYYYKARFYSPALGRFLQVDPVGTSDQINLYAYVGDDPVNRVDPLGLAACPPNDKNCIDNPTTEHGTQPQPKPDTKTQAKDEVVVTARKQQKFSDGTKMKLPVSGTIEQGFRVTEKSITPVPFTRSGTQTCSDGSSRAANALNVGDIGAGNSGGHTHGGGDLDPLPGPEDGAMAGATGQPAYEVSRRGAFAIESTSVGYRVRMLSGGRLSGSERSELEGLIGGWNRNNGGSGVRCTFTPN